MKRTSKLIFLLMGFVAASCIVQLVIVVNNVNPAAIHQYVERQRLVYPSTFWSVFKPATNPGTTNPTVEKQKK